MAVATTWSPSTVPQSLTDAVGGDQDAAPLVATADELEQQVCCGRARTAGSRTLRGSAASGLLSCARRCSSLPSECPFTRVAHQRRRRGEEHRAQPCRMASRPSAMARCVLADARWPLDQQRFAVGHPATGRQVPNLLGIERRLRREVEGLQRAPMRKLGDRPCPSGCVAPRGAPPPPHTAAPAFRAVTGFPGPLRPAGRRAERASPSASDGSRVSGSTSMPALTSHLPRAARIRPGIAAARSRAARRRSPARPRRGRACPACPTRRHGGGRGRPARSRRPRRRSWQATSAPACEIRTVPSLTSTVTCAPISRHGTL